MFFVIKLSLYFVSANDGHHPKATDSSKEMLHMYCMHVVLYGLHWYTASFQILFSSWSIYHPTNPTLYNLDTDGVVKQPTEERWVNDKVESFWKEAVVAWPQTSQSGYLFPDRDSNRALREFKSTSLTIYLGNKPLCFIKEKEHFDHLRHYQLFTNNSNLQRCLVSWLFPSWNFVKNL
jgi:hypothetical protein